MSKFFPVFIIGGLLFLVLLYIFPLLLGHSFSDAGEGERALIAVSYDEGKSFEHAVVDATSILPDVYDIAFVEESGLAVAGTSNGLYMSFDEGKSWQRYADAEGAIAGPVYSVAFDTRPSGALYFSMVKGGRGYIYELGDLSSPPSVIYEHAEGVIVRSIRYKNGRLYFGMNDGEILVYTIAERVFRGVGTLEHSILQIVLKSGGAMYAATDRGGIYVSHNGGSSWQQTARKSVDPKGLYAVGGVSGGVDFPGTLYVASADGLIKTNTYGASWEILNTVVPQSNISAAEISRTGTVYAAHENIVYRSTDGGYGWALSSPVPAGRVISVIRSFDDAGIVFIGTRQPRRERSSSPFPMIRPPFSTQ